MKQAKVMVVATLAAATCRVWGGAPNTTQEVPTNAVAAAAAAPKQDTSHNQTEQSIAFSSNAWTTITGLPCGAAPVAAELLDESGEFALFAGETAEDAASNKVRDADPDRPYRNSLFLRRRKTDGTGEWRVLLTTGTNWCEAKGMSEWCSSESRWLKSHFLIKEAKFALDRRHLWLVCNTYNHTFDIVCSYDVCKHEFRTLIDGSAIDEQPDGTILVRGKKSYPNDGLGAAWRDVWITPEGKTVRKGKITLRGCDM